MSIDAALQFVVANSPWFCLIGTTLAFVLMGLLVSSLRWDIDSLTENARRGEFMSFDFRVIWFFSGLLVMVVTFPMLTLAEFHVMPFSQGIWMTILNVVVSVVFFVPATGWWIFRNLIKNPDKNFRRFQMWRISKLWSAFNLLPTVLVISLIWLCW